MPASAATGAQCKKLTSTATKFTVASCTPLTATGGSGAGPVSGTTPGQTKGTVNVKVTWAKKKGTTSASVKFAPTTLGKCKIGTTRLKITGKVTGGTGAAAKVIKKGQLVSGTVCLAKSGSASLEPGTVVKF
jgi:hypothetical protein